MTGLGSSIQSTQGRSKGKQQPPVSQRERPLGKPSQLRLKLSYRTAQRDSVGDTEGPTRTRQPPCPSLLIPHTLEPALSAPVAITIVQGGDWAQEAAA